MRNSTFKITLTLALSHAYMGEGKRRVTMNPIDDQVAEFPSRAHGSHKPVHAKKTARPLSKSFLLWCRSLHIYFSMFALLALFFFAGTGFMLNHPNWFKLEKTITRERHAVLPDEVATGNDRLALVEYLRSHENAHGEVKSYNQGDDQTEIHFSSPGAAMTFTVTHVTGDTNVLEETRNVLALMGDLHKAKYTGNAWPRVVDATSLLLIFISLTGLVLWCVLPKRRTLGIISLASGIVIVIGVYLWMIP